MKKTISKAKAKSKPIVKKTIEEDIEESESDIETDSSEETDEIDEELEQIDKLEELKNDDENSEDDIVSEKSIIEETEEIDEVEEIDKDIIIDDYNETGDNEKLTEDNIKEENCIYQYDDIIDINELEIPAVEIPKENRITDPDMTHYEKVRILGLRTKQIIMGAKPMIKSESTLTAVDIAKYELINKTIPLIIKRPLPNNTYELWKVNELNYKDENEYEKNLLDELNNRERTYNIPKLL